MKKKKVAILSTCHNRVSTTIFCYQYLYEQICRLNLQYNIDVYICDSNNKNNRINCNYPTWIYKTKKNNPVSNKIRYLIKDVVDWDKYYGFIHIDSDDISSDSVLLRCYNNLINQVHPVTQYSYIYYYNKKIDKLIYQLRYSAWCAYRTYSVETLKKLNYNLISKGIDKGIDNHIDHNLRTVNLKPKILNNKFGEIILDIKSDGENITSWNNINGVELDQKYILYPFLPNLSEYIEKGEH